MSPRPTVIHRISGLVGQQSSAVDSGGIVCETVGDGLERRDWRTEHLPRLYVVDPESEGCRSETCELRCRQHLPVNEARHSERRLCG